MASPDSGSIRRFLVTGGAGFIGSHVVDALTKRGDAVIVIDNLDTGSLDNLPNALNIIPQKVSDVIGGSIGFIEGSIQDVDLLSHLVNSADAVIHLAAIASVQRCQDDPEIDRAVNFDGLRTIMRLCASKTDSCPVVFASSAAVYGEPTNLPIRESDSTTPVSNYGISKLDAERLITDGNGIVASTAFRFFNVYGPRQDPSSPYSGVISIFIDRALRSLPLRIDGDGEQSRDFIHVSDVVQGLLLGLEALLDNGTAAKGHGAVYNLCSETGLTIGNLVSEVEHHLATAILRTYGPARSGDIRHSIGSSSRAQEHLGFSCKMSFSEGLGDLIDFLQRES